MTRSFLIKKFILSHRVEYYYTIRERSFKILSNMFCCHFYFDALVAAYNQIFKVVSQCIFTQNLRLFNLKILKNSLMKLNVSNFEKNHFGCRKIIYE